MKSKVSEDSDEDIICCESCMWGSRATRFMQITGTLILPLIPAFVVIILTSVRFSESVQRYNQATFTRNDIDQIGQLGEVMRSLHMEMEGIATLLVTNEVPILGKREDFYSRTDRALLELGKWDDSNKYYSHENLIYELREFRDQDRPPNSTLLKEVHFYTNMVSKVINWASDLIRQGMPNSMWAVVIRFQALSYAIQDFAIVRALGSAYFFAGSIPDDEHQTFLSAFITGHENLAVSAQFGLILQNSNHNEIEKSMEYLRKMVHEKDLSKEPLIDGFIWNRIYSAYLNNMMRILINQLDHDEQKLKEIADNSLTNLIFRAIVIGFMLFAFAPFIIISARRSDQTLLDYTLTMEINSKALAREKRHTERLIKEMLPSTIAYKMMKHGSVEAEYFESVTVFFSDVVDFAEISMASSPYDIVAFLNGIYNLIDARLQWYDVYKVETIGCVYMVVSGLPLRNGTRHASEIAKMALDIMAITETMCVPHIPERRILLRVGAHTGKIIQCFVCCHFVLNFVL